MSSKEIQISAIAKLCPDGLLFDSKNPNQEKCDYPFNVDCGAREYVRKLCHFLSRTVDFHKNKNLQKNQSKELTLDVTEQMVFLIMMKIMYVTGKQCPLVLFSSSHLSNLQS